MSAWAVGSLLLTLIVVPFMVNEAGELAPWLAGRMVQWGASLLGTPEARVRYAEEWAANLERVPGKLTKLAWACGLLLWSAPRMRVQIRSRERKAMPGRASFRGRAGNFLVTLAGGSPEILKIVPPERARFQSLGSAILITSSVAMVSMWFALSSALGINGILAVPVAVFWGLAIMGIDRMLIISMPASSSRKFAIAMPRLVLAIVLGTVISTPLVLRIFQPEINWELSVMALQQHPAVHQVGLLPRLQALSNLSSGNLTAAMARFLLFLLFLVIECLPVTVRLLQKPGLYEKLAPTSRLH
jgi:hypothetical protein